MAISGQPQAVRTLTLHRWLRSAYPRLAPTTRLCPSGEEDGPAGHGSHLQSAQREGTHIDWMKAANPQQRPMKAGRVNTLALWLLFPALLLMQVLGGSAALFHEHGSAGNHLHVLSATPDLHLVSSWHQARHEGEVDHPSSDREPAEITQDILIQVPASVVIAPSGRELAGKSTVQLHAIQACLLRCVVDAPTTPGSPPAPLPERPQIRSRRSGIATLLRSSHAILI